MIRDLLMGGAFLLGLLVSFVTAAASPDVTLNDAHGKPHHLSEYIGRGQ